MSAWHRQGFVFEPLSGKWWPVEPCPFCGCKDIHVLKHDGTECILACMNCGARGENWHHREERAIPAWNRRAVAADPPPRHTVLGMLPVNVDSIDRLDCVLSRALDAVKQRDAELARVALPTAEFRRIRQLGVKYAAAHYAYEETLGDAEFAAWRQARTAYREHRRDLAEDDGDDA